MRLSLKQKQVLGVTLMVALIVIALSLVHLSNTAGVLLGESRDRFELFGSSVYSQAAAAITTQETAYNDVRTSKFVQSALQSIFQAAVYMHTQGIHTPAFPVKVLKNAMYEND